MERSVKCLSADAEIPEPPKFGEVGLITFSWIKDLNKRYHNQDGELSEELKNTLFQYAQHKYYWEKNGRGIRNQWKKTLQLLQDMDVFQ